MGYTRNDGRFANTEEVTLFDGTATESGTTDPVELGDRGTLRLSLDVTAGSAEGGGTNEIQTIAFSGIDGDVGTIRISADSGATYSEPFALGEGGLERFQSALDDLLGGGNSLVEPSMEVEGVLTVEFLGELAGTDVPLLVVDDSELVPEPGANAIQTVTVTASGGEYTLSHNDYPTGTIAYDADALTVQTALESIPSIGEGNVSVTAEGNVYTVEYVGALAGQPVPELVADTTSLIGSPVTNAIVQYDLDSTDGGTYTIEHVSTEEATGALAYDADAQTIQTAIEGLNAIGAGNVSVSKEGALVTIEFIGSMAGTNAPMGSVFAVDAESLTGSGTPYSISVDRVQEGTDAAEASVDVVTVQDGQAAGVPDVSVSVSQEASGGAYALDVAVETSHDGQAWEQLGSFAQAVAVGSTRKVLTGCDRFVRATYELTGEGAEVTFSLSGEAV